MVLGRTLWIAASLVVGKGILAMRGWARRAGAWLLGLAVVGNAGFVLAIAVGVPFDNTAPGLYLGRMAWTFAGFLVLSSGTVKGLFEGHREN